jgi:hypothetical protein
MAIKAFADKSTLFWVACKAFRIREYCHSYERWLEDENEEVAKCLNRLTDNYRQL